MFRNICTSTVIGIFLFLCACTLIPQGPYWEDKDWEKNFTDVVSRNLAYPDNAWKEGFPSGTGTVRFTFSSGKLSDVHLTKSTGSAILDKALVNDIETIIPPPVSPEYFSVAHPFELTLELNPTANDFRDFLYESVTTKLNFPDADFPSQAAIIYVDGSYIDGKWSSITIHARQGGVEETSTYLLDVLKAAPLPAAPPALKNTAIAVNIRYCISIDADFCLKNTLRSFPDFHGISTMLSPSEKPSAELRELTDKAEKGDISAQYNVGHIHETKVGAPQDYEQAIYWYRKAALQGNYDAQNRLNYLYSEGLDVPFTEGGLIGYLTSQSTQGAPDAQTFLGWWYSQSKDIEPNYELAASWLKKAADQRYAKAEYLLGLLYKHGTGVLQDYSVAMNLFMQAAEGGSIIANNMVGKLYEEGDGVDKNYESAATWYRKAAPDMWLAKCNLLRMYLTEGLKPISREEADAWTNVKNQDAECFNAIAWQLSTTPILSRRDSKEAIKLIGEAIDRKGKDWARLDTLAAAQAADADYQNAIISEQDAIKRLKSANANAPELYDMRKRLVLFTNHQAFSEDDTY